MNSNALAVTLVGGYLGSGKTTLINHLLQQNNHLQMAVLVNDFGALSIDAALIEAEEGNIISLSGGCVCCSYGNDLMTALLDILAMSPRPDQVVIETSGVAIPSAVAASVSLMQEFEVNSTLVLVNAELIRQQAIDRFVGDTITRQLQSADLLVVNKTDLITRNQSEDLQRWLDDEFPQQQQISVQFANLPLSVVLDSERLPVIHDTPARLEHASLFHTFTLDLPDPIDANALQHLLCGDAANLVRAKGFVNDQQAGATLLQIVGRRGEIKRASTAVADSTGFSVVCIALADSTSEGTIRSAIEQGLETDRMA